jgi:hypothetical protein
MNNMKGRIIIGAAVALAAVFLMPGTTGAQEAACPEGTHAIYTGEGVLVSCEEVIGSPESCPDDAAPGYLESGQLAGCFTGAVDVEETCQPGGVDTDSDGLGDACDPCPNSPDCDGDKWGDGIELYLGTDPLDACPDIVGSDDAWPLDINMDTFVTMADVFKYSGKIGKSVSADPLLRRLDLNMDNFITMADIYLYAGKLGQSCTEGMGALESECWGCIELPIKTASYHVGGGVQMDNPLALAHP